MPGNELDRGAEGTIRHKGKVAIVTVAGTHGPMPGTGLPTAMLYAEHGARLLLVDLETQRGEETLAVVKQKGGQASVFQADVTDEGDCWAMVEACLERYGALDVLFNNVGMGAGGTVTEIGETLLDRAIDVNLKSKVLTCKHAVPSVAASGGGSIINVSSIDGLRAGSSRHVPYAVAKAGVIQLTRTMAVPHGRDNIRVDCIAPGHLYAPFVAHISEEEPELRCKAGPLGAEGNGWAGLYLASDESRWVSGVVLPIDAGLLAATPLALWDHLR